jgi:excisionase family DNA binding protein
MTNLAVEAEQAAVASDALSRGRVVIVPKRGAAKPIEIPAAASMILAEVLDRLRRGQHVHLVPDDQVGEITTQEAADLLNVSRPYVVGLIDRGELPSRKVGSRRRLKLADVLMYREIQTARQRAAADALANEAQELGLY